MTDTYFDWLPADLLRKIIDMIDTRVMIYVKGRWREYCDGKMDGNDCPVDLTQLFPMSWGESVEQGLRRMKVPSRWNRETATNLERYILDGVCSCAIVVHGYDSNRSEMVNIAQIQALSLDMDISICAECGAIEADMRVCDFCVFPHCRECIIRCVCGADACIDCTRECFECSNIQCPDCVRGCDDCDGEFCIDCMCDKPRPNGDVGCFR